MLNIVCISWIRNRGILVENCFQVSAWNAKNTVVWRCSQAACVHFASVLCQLPWCSQGLLSSIHSKIFLAPMIKLLQSYSGLLVNMRMENCPTCAAALEAKVQRRSIWHLSPIVPRLCTITFVSESYFSILEFHRTWGKKFTVNVTNWALLVWFVLVLHNAEIINLFLYVGWPELSTVHLLHCTCPKKLSWSELALHWLFLSGQD